jgi:deazaflavin-dependent oxidoreductase (nitroreductase family)
VIPPRWAFRVLWSVDRALDRVTNGRFDSVRPGPPTLRLTTTGRRTGERRVNGVYYVVDDAGWAVVASNAGSDRDPGWWLNLQAHPEASVRIRGREHAVRGRRATSEEEQRLWPRLDAMNPGYREYRAVRSRPMLVVILERQVGS